MCVCVCVCVCVRARAFMRPRMCARVYCISSSLYLFDLIVFTLCMHAGLVYVTYASA